LKQHPFFASIDWKKLYNKEVTPSWVPKLVISLSFFSHFQLQFRISLLNHIK